MFAHSLKSTFTAGILATSLALTSLTPTSASAAMSEDEIAGLIGLLLLGVVIHQSRDNDPEPVVTPPQPTHDDADRNWRRLPANCRRDIQTRRRGTVRMFTQRCLNNNYRHVDRLPQDCHIRVRTENGQRRQGFAARCLREAGFRVARH